MNQYIKNIISVVALVAVVAFFSPAAFAAPIFVYSGDVSDGGYVPGELIVKYKNDSRPFRVVKLPRGMSVSSAVAEYNERNDVEFAEPNYVATAYAVPNDTYYSYQWHLDNENYGGIQMETAWDVTTGSGIVVAVVDSGVAYEDYNAGKGEKYYRAPDFDGACFVQGYDFVNDDSHANDDNSHGTHVAGTVAQSTNNNMGTAGVAYDACLMPVKVLDRNGNGSYADVAAGIRYAVDNGADVVNLSLGGPTDGQVVEDAVAYAYNNGVTVVAATGNDNGAVGYPAAYDDYVIAVGATRYDEARAPYSNYGPSVDVVAPGGDTSVDQNGDGYGDGVLQNTFNPSSKRTNDFGYYFFQGTSMATPHVAGVAALVLANGNASSPDEVRRALQETAEDLGDAGRDDLYGWGLIDAAAALGWTAGPVDEAPSVSVTNPVDGSVVSGVVVISADATDDNGVARVDFYANNNWIGAATSAPYEVSWDTTSVSDGSYSVSAVAEDSAGQTSNDSVSVLVDNVNDAPIADAGPDQTVEDADENGSESVVLDGSGSYDVDGSIVSYEWYEGATLLATGAAPSVSFALGDHSVDLVVVDDEGATATDSVLVSVVEPSPDPTVAVDSIVYSGEGGKDSNRHTSIAFSLVDDSGSAVSGASVTFSVYLDGTLYWSEVGTTDSSGAYVTKFTNSPSGCYETTVSDVSASGYVWDGTTPSNYYCK